MDQNRLAAWWLGLAPSRQEELLESAGARPLWLEASLAEANLGDERAAIDDFLTQKRRERDDVSQDAGRDPGGSPH